METTMETTMEIKSPLYIGEAVHELIKDVIRDYPIIADEGTKFPFCTWKRISGSEIGSKDGPYSRTQLVEIFVVDDNYEGSVQNAEKVYDKLNNYRGLVRGFNINEITLNATSESYTENGYVQRLVFSIEWS